MLLNYFLYSLPLILLMFLVAGLAISMLLADILPRVDVSNTVLSVAQREIKPLIQMFTREEEVSPVYTMMINMKVQAMLNETIPLAKALLYAMGMAKLLVLEIGPLITALLLSGPIGGSYSGEVAMMQSTAQNKLLLGIWQLVYAMVCCHPHLSFATVKLSQHNTCPAKVHYDGVGHALKYLYQT
jgi:hypothetical protein